ncbi:MAG TPA: hypothetical protein VI386_03615 [Candidatus Sulfotelmatobacter sp.]
MLFRVYGSASIGIETGTRASELFATILTAMLDTFLVPERTVVNAKGDSPTTDVSGAASRVFLLTLEITQIVEQESLDVAIFGSPDGATWGAKPILAFPQKFYCEESPLLLDLTAHGEVKFVRAHWEVARWGRGSETPMFEFSLRIKEVPTDILRELTPEAHTRV